MSRCLSNGHSDFDTKELEPLKLPGKLGQMTGNVLYPNESSQVWDLNGKGKLDCACSI